MLCSYDAAGSAICARVKVPQLYWESLQPTNSAAFMKQHVHRPASHPTADQTARTQPPPAEPWEQLPAFSTLAIGCTLDCLRCVVDDAATTTAATATTAAGVRNENDAESQSTDTDTDTETGAGAGAGAGTGRITTPDVFQYAAATGGLITVRMTH